MAWFGRRGSYAELRAQVAEFQAERDDRQALVDEYTSTQRQLTEAREDFAMAGTFDQAQLDSYRSHVTGLQQRLTEIRSRGIAESRAIGGFPWVLPRRG